jgi:hypothetical protein
LQRGFARRRTDYLPIQNFNHTSLDGRYRRYFLVAKFMSRACPRLEREALPLPIGMLSSKLPRKFRDARPRALSRPTAQVAAPPRGTYPSSSTVAKSGMPPSNLLRAVGSIQTNRERQTRGK